MKPPDTSTVFCLWQGSALIHHSGREQNRRHSLNQDTEKLLSDSNIVPFIHICGLSSSQLHLTVLASGGITILAQQSQLICTGKILYKDLWSPWFWNVGHQHLNVLDSKTDVLLNNKLGITRFLLLRTNSSWIVKKWGSLLHKTKSNNYWRELLYKKFGHRLLLTMEPPVVPGL